MSNAYNFSPGRYPELWEIVNTKTGKKIAGDVMRSHSNTKFTAWLPDWGTSERPIIAATLEKLSAELDAHFNGIGNGSPRRARLRPERTTCGELARGDWVQLERRGLFSSGLENAAREVLRINPVNREKVNIWLAIALDKGDGQASFDATIRDMDETCYVLYVDQDFRERPAQPA